jgi:hypothetical protein
VSSPLDIAARIAAVLEEDGLPYAIGGALALGVWGTPRATNDIDMTVFAREAELDRVLDSLERAGLIVDRESAAKDVARIGLFKARAGRRFVDVFLLGHPQYDAMAKRRRAVTDAAGRTLVFISPEDLVVHKLLFARDKDVTDLENLFAVRTDLDLGYVRSWLSQMVPAGDRRLTILADLERRFVR